MTGWRWPAFLIAAGAVTGLYATVRLATLEEPDPVDASMWKPAFCVIEQVNARFPEASYIAKSGRSKDKGTFSVRVRYRYSVSSGPDRTGDRFCSVDKLCGEREDIEAARGLRPGAQVPCFVSRRDAAESAIRLATPGQVKSARTPHLVTGVVGGLLAAFGLVALLRRRRADTPIPPAQVVEPQDPDPGNLV